MSYDDAFPASVMEKVAPLDVILPAENPVGAAGVRSDAVTVTDTASLQHVPVE